MSWAQVSFFFASFYFTNNFITYRMPLHHLSQNNNEKKGLRHIWHVSSPSKFFIYTHPIHPPHDIHHMHNWPDVAPDDNGHHHCNAQQWWASQTTLALNEMLTSPLGCFLFISKAAAFLCYFFFVQFLCI